MTRFAAPIAEQIWDMKYRLKEADDTPIDDVTSEDAPLCLTYALNRPTRNDCK